MTLSKKTKKKIQKLLILLLISLFFYIVISNYLLSKQILVLLVDYYSDINIITLKAEETIYSIFYIMGLLNFISLLPLFVLLFYLWINDALYKKERKFIKLFPLIYVISFSGLIFGFFIGIGVMIPFMLKYNAEIGLVNTITLYNLIKTLVFTSVSFMIIFLIPVLMKVLTKLDIVNVNVFRKYRKYFVFISLVFSAVISPAEFFTMFVIFIPIYLNFELGILISRK